MLVLVLVGGEDEDESVSGELVKADREGNEREVDSNGCVEEEEEGEGGDRDGEAIINGKKERRAG